MKRKFITTVLGLLMCIPFMSVNRVSALEKSIQAINDMDRISNSGPRVQIQNGEETGYVYYGESGINIFHGEERVHLDTNFDVIKLVAVDDVNGDGFTDFLTYQNAPDLADQLLVVSGADGRILSTRKLSRESYSDSLGFTEANCYIYDMRYIGNGEALLVYDYSVSKISVADCQELVRYTEADNIWKAITIDDVDGDGVREIAYCSQNNTVGIINGSTGEVIAKQNPSEVYELEHPWRTKVTLQATMNTWDIEYIDGILYALTEDGYVVKYDPFTLEPMMKTQLGIIDADNFRMMLRNQYDYYSAVTYHITGVDRTQFRGYKIADRVDNYLLINCFTGDLDGTAEWKDFTFPPRCLVYDMTTDEIVSIMSLDNSNATYEKNCFGVYDEQPCVAMISYTEKGLARIGVYSLTGELIDQRDLKLDIADVNRKLVLSWNGEKYTLEVLGQGTVDISADLKETSYCYDSITSSLLKVYGDRMTIVYANNGVKDTIVQYDKDMKTVLWEYHASKSFKNKGFEFLNVDQDYDGDGENDILAIVNGYNDDNVPQYSYYIIVSSRGEEIRNRTVLIDDYWSEGKHIYDYLISQEFKLMNDINDDYVYELLCGDTVVSSKSNKIVGSVSGYVDAKGDQYKIGDVNKDSVDDILVMTDKEMRIYLSDVYYSYGTVVNKYYKSGTYASLNSSYDPQNTTAFLDDINGDGVKELGMIDHNDVGYEIFKIVDGASLNTMYYLCEDGINDDGEAFRPMEYDLNGDGYKELYGRVHWQYGIYDGRTGEFMLNVNNYKYDEGDIYINEYHPNYNVPFWVLDESECSVVVSDIDGSKYVAFARNEYDREVFTMRNYIVMYAMDDLENEYKISYTANENEGPGLLRSVDNSEGIALLTGNASTSIIDLKNKAMLASFKVAAKKGYQFDENTILIANESDVLYRLDTRNCFTLTEPIPETTDNYMLHLAWQDSQDYSVMTIYDNGTAVYSGSDSETDIKLVEGEHDIVLSMSDGQGKTYQETYKITVSEQPVNIYWMFAVAAVLLIASFMLGRYQKIAVNRKYRKEASK